MKMLLKILLIFLFSELNDVQAYDDSYAIHDSRDIKPRQKRYSKGYNPEDNEIKGSGAMRSCKICGVNFASPSAGMVVKGNDVNPPYKYPWSVALQIQGETFCGGSLLNENYILTAAHCLIKQEEEEEAVKVKEEKVEYMKPNEFTVSFVTKTSRVERGPPIQTLIPHPGFATSKLKHDIALIKLSRKVTCSKFKNPICLPSPDAKVSIGQMFTIVGWGTAGNNSKNSSKTLQEAKIKNVNFNKCKKDFPSNMESLAYCLMGIRGQSPCMGDSGGPMFDKRGKKYFLYGVTSIHSSELCEVDSPFLYTSVSKHIQWIKKILGSSFPKQEKETAPGKKDSQGRNGGDTGGRLLGTKGGTPGLPDSHTPKGKPGSQGRNGGDVGDRLPETNFGFDEILDRVRPKGKHGSQGRNGGDVGDRLPETNFGFPELPDRGRPKGKPGSHGRNGGDVGDRLPETNGGFPEILDRGRPKGKLRSQGRNGGDVGDHVSETNGGFPEILDRGRPKGKPGCQGKNGGDVGDRLPKTKGCFPGLPDRGRPIGVPGCQRGNQGSDNSDVVDRLPETRRCFPGLPDRSRPIG